MELKQLIAEVIFETKYDLIKNVEDVPYKKRHNDSVLIKLNINKVLNRFNNDYKEKAITNRKSKNIISQSRIDNSKEYWINYSKNQRWINPSNKRRSIFPDMTFYASIIYFDNKNKLDFEDGRHRLIALKELNYKNAMFEVPKNQIKLFKKFK